MYTEVVVSGTVVVVSGTVVVVVVVVVVARGELFVNATSIVPRPGSYGPTGLKDGVQPGTGVSVNTYAQSPLVGLESLTNDRSDANEAVPPDGGIVRWTTGAVVQLVEERVISQGVEGSAPSPVTVFVTLMRPSITTYPTVTDSPPRFPVAAMAPNATTAATPAAAPPSERLRLGEGVVGVDVGEVLMVFMFKPSTASGSSPYPVFTGGVSTCQDPAERPAPMASARPVSCVDAHH